LAVKGERSIMANRSKRAAVLWVFMVALLLIQAAWAGAQQPPAADLAPGAGSVELWGQDVSTTTPWPHICQDFGTISQAEDTYIADDFASNAAWRIDTIFVPGDLVVGACSLGCAHKLNWLIYADDGDKPVGDPSSATPPAFWSLSLSPSDPQVTLSHGTGGELTDVTLNLSSPITLPGGHYWLVFYPTLQYQACSCKYGRQPSDSTNAADAQVINPGGGLELPTEWTSVRSSSAFFLSEQDMAFQLRGSVVYQLGDFVWYDTNQNGLQDWGEAAVSGIDVDWHDNAECTGEAKATSSTGSFGNYAFIPPAMGEQCLQFKNIPAGWKISPENQGQDDGVDSDAHPELAQIRDIDLTSDDLTQDMGLFVEGKVGGRVWCDKDGDAHYDSGEEMSGAQVQLYRTLTCDRVDSVIMGTVPTDANGQFTYSDQWTGPTGTPICYSIEVVQSSLGDCIWPLYARAWPEIELDANSPTSLNNSLGFDRGLGIAGRAWYDTDQDGIQEQGEPGVDRLPVNLFGEAQCTGPILKTVDSDATGLYSFDGLAGGSFCLDFVLHAGYTITAQNQGSDDTLDSDADPSEGQIRNISLAGGSRLYESVGLYAQGLIGGSVFCDGNANDRYDAGEGLKDVRVAQIDDDDCDGTGDGDQVDKHTGTDGFYSFDLRPVGPPGDPFCYTIHVETSTVGTCNTPITPTGWAVGLSAGDATHLDVDFGFRRTLGLDKRIYLPLVLYKNG
jgi:hypothetical protein